MAKLYSNKKIESSFFHLNPEILVKLFNLIYYLTLTPTLTVTPQLSPNPNPQIKCVQNNHFIYV